MFAKVRTIGQTGKRWKEKFFWRVGECGLFLQVVPVLVGRDAVVRLEQLDEIGCVAEAYQCADFRNGDVASVFQQLRAFSQSDFQDEVFGPSVW